MARDNLVMPRENLIEGFDVPEIVVGYDISRDEMRPVTQADYDELRREVERLQRFRHLILNLASMSLKDLQQVVSALRDNQSVPRLKAFPIVKDRA